MASEEADGVVRSTAKLSIIASLTKHLMYGLDRSCLKSLFRDAIKAIELVVGEKLGTDKVGEKAIRCS